MSKINTVHLIYDKDVCLFCGRISPNPLKTHWEGFNYFAVNLHTYSQHISWDSYEPCKIIDYQGYLQRLLKLFS